MNRVLLHTAFSHSFDMTEILLEKDVKPQVILTSCLKSSLYIVISASSYEDHPEEKNKDKKDEKDDKKEVKKEK